MGATNHEESQRSSGVNQNPDAAERHDGCEAPQFRRPSPDRRSDRDTAPAIASANRPRRFPVRCGERRRPSRSLYRCAVQQHQPHLGSYPKGMSESQKAQKARCWYNGLSQAKALENSGDFFISCEFTSVRLFQPAKDARPLLIAQAIDAFCPRFQREQNLDSFLQLLGGPRLCTVEYCCLLLSGHAASISVPAQDGTAGVDGLVA